MTPSEWWAVCDSKTRKIKAESQAMSPKPMFKKSEIETMRDMFEGGRNG